MPKKVQVIEIPPFHELAQLWDEMLEEEERMKAEVKQQLSESPPTKQKLRSGLPNYREQAMEAYRPHVCIYCGFGIKDVLEVAHLDCDPRNCDLTNLALLCPTCHRMHDIGLIPTEVVRHMRDTERKTNWSKLMKDAAAKAVATKKKTRTAKKAHKTRQERRARETEST